MKKQSRRKISAAIGLLCLLIGAGAAGYPLIRNVILEYQAAGEIEKYEEALQQQESEQLNEMLAQARVYNASLVDGGDTGSEEAAAQTNDSAGGEIAAQTNDSADKETAAQANAVSVVAYDDLLAVTDAIGYLEIPKLNIYLPVYHGLEEETLQKGIGHIPETSLPIGGESTHCVLSGHSGLPAARLLTELDQMEEGDRFYIHVLDETLVYEVDQIAVVLPEDSSLVQIEEGKDYVTLLTCTPYGVNTHRLLVRGERVEGELEAAIKVTAQNGTDSSSEERGNQILSWRILTWAGALIIGILLLILGIWLVVRGNRRNRNL